MKSITDFINKVHQGNNLDILKEMPDMSVDCMICDPNYGISFMNKHWDIDVPTVDQWKECLRVLKSGAFAFIMSSPRQDVLSENIVRIRQAGFDTNFTSIYWTYACLCDDTEILTHNGWERWHNTNIFKSKEILIYDCETDNYKWEIPSKWNNYKIKDTCYRIKSDSTDQLVTRNHRVLIEREGELLFRFAEELGQTVSVPYLESLFMLSENVFNIPSVVKKEKGVWKILFNQLSSESKYSQIFNSTQQKIQNWWSTLDRKKKERMVGKNNRIRKSILERWSNVFQDTWKLYWNQVCKVSSKIFTNGSQRWLCDGTPFTCSTAPETMSFENRSGSSYKSQSNRQQIGEFGTIREQQNSQTMRKWKQYKTTLAVVAREYYEGIVFCPTVSTGCFIARRNNKIFLTGNSGFPKAMNIGKAIDKKAGIQREVIGQSNNGSGANLIKLANHKKGDTGIGTWDGSGKIFDITTATSPEAKLLDGSYAGFQPKPAVEIIIVAMKPLSEKTYVEHALKNGKGITWLDDGRIPFQADSEKWEVSNDKRRGSLRKMENRTDRQNSEEIFTSNNNGRFPANLLVSDDILNDNINHKGCSSPSNVSCESIFRPEQGEYNHQGDIYPDSGSYSRYFSLDSWWDKTIKNLPKEVQDVFPFFIVAKTSQSEKNIGCENLIDEVYNDETRLDKDAIGCNNPRNRSGTAKMGNTHVSVKPLKLFSYLTTIGSRPNDIVIDPFAGSGTLGVACHLLNRKFICIDMESEYVDIANSRIGHIQSDKPHVQPVMNTVMM